MARHYVYSQNTNISFKYIIYVDFLVKNLASFVSLSWQLDNPY